MIELRDLLNSNEKMIIKHDMEWESDEHEI